MRHLIVAMLCRVFHILYIMGFEVRITRKMWAKHRWILFRMERKHKKRYIEKPNRI